MISRTDVMSPSPYAYISSLSAVFKAMPLKPAFQLSLVEALFEEVAQVDGNHKVGSKHQQDDKRSAGGASLASSQSHTSATFPHRLFYYSNTACISPDVSESPTSQHPCLVPARAA